MCDVNKLAYQLLELSRQLATTSKSFRTTLKTDGINFSICSQDVDYPGQDDIHPGTKKGKKSKFPSQKKRDAHRRKLFLMKKIEETTSTKPSETTKPTEKHVNKVTSTCEFLNLGKHI